MILSLMPFIPVLRQHIPRMIRSILTPAAEALYSEAIIPGSQREFIFAFINAFLPDLANSVSRFIISVNLSRSQIGATASLFHAAGSE